MSIFQKFFDSINNTLILGGKRALGYSSIMFRDFTDIC